MPPRVEPKFSLGQVVVTPGFLEAMHNAGDKSCPTFFAMCKETGASWTSTTDRRMSSPFGKACGY